MHAPISLHESFQKRYFEKLSFEKIRVEKWVHATGAHITLILTQIIITKRMDVQHDKLMITSPKLMVTDSSPKPNVVTLETFIKQIFEHKD